ncbi:MAG TPA: hypothetical protein V6D03_04755 [Candidatus Caenarcaniphilales bacterium]
MSKIAWASLLSGPTILGVALYPAAGFAEPVTTSASSLHTEFSSLADSSIQQTVAMPFVVSQQPSESETPLPKVQPGIVPTQEEVRQIQEQLKETAEEIENAGTPGRTPAFTLFAPSGYGADRNTVFATGVVVANERIDDNVDAALNFGVGLLDSTQSVGLELSYALLSFGTVEGGRNFGDGAFNLKVHRQFPQERLSVAAGYIGFATIGDATDYQNSPYGVVTKFFVLRPDLDKPFSRVAVTAGIGAGEAFQLEDEFFERNSVGPFGSVALRLGRPVSAIAEWGGEDLGLGISYALRLAPNTNFVITPSVRDIVGAGEGPRFIVGTGISYRF